MPDPMGESSSRFWREKRAPKRELGDPTTLEGSPGVVGAVKLLRCHDPLWGSSISVRDIRRFLSCGVSSSWRDDGTKSSSKAKLSSVATSTVSFSCPQPSVATRTDARGKLDEIIILERFENCDCS